MKMKSSSCFLFIQFIALGLAMDSEVAKILEEMGRKIERLETQNDATMNNAYGK